MICHRCTVGKHYECEGGCACPDGRHKNPNLEMKIRGLVKSKLPDEQRLQVLITLCADLAGSINK